MEDKEFLELHNNVTSFSRGEQPVFPKAESIDLPRLEDVENYVPEAKPVENKITAPQINQEQLNTDIDKAVDKYFNADAAEANALPDDNEMQNTAEVIEKETPSAEKVWNDIVESDTAKAIRRTNAYKKYAYNKEAVLTEARQISKALEVPEDLVLSSPETLDKMREVYKAYEKEKDIDKVYQRYSGLKGLAEKDSGAAALAIANLEDAKVAHGIVENLYVGASNDWYGLKRNMIGAKGFWGNSITKDDEEKINEYDKNIKALKEVPDFFDAPIDNAVGKTTQQLAMQFRQYGPAGLLGAAAGYFGTKAIGVLGGTFAGGPAGSIAGAVAMNQLAKTNAMKLGGMAARIGSGAFMFNELAGQYYLEARSYKNKAGGQQFTDDQARMMAGLQASIETIIEMGSTEAVLKIFSKNPANPATEQIKEIINKAGNKATAIAMLKQKLMSLGGKVVKGGSVETGEESAQQLSTDLVGNYFAAYVAPNGHEKYGLKVYRLQELAERSLEAGKEALVPSFTMAGLGSGFSTIGVVHDTMNAMKMEEVIKGVGLDYDNWMKNTKGVAMLRELKEKFADSKLAKEHPEEAQALLKETLKESGFEEVFVDTNLVKQEEGGTELLYQMAADAGIEEEKVQTAIEKNETLAIPTEVYAKSVKDHPLAEKLLDKISFDKEGECLERSRKYVASLKRGWDMMIDAESKRKMEAAYNVIKEDVGEELATDAMGLVSMYPDNPSVGAKRKAGENRQTVYRMLKPIINVLEGDVQEANEKTAEGGVEQAQWYQEWMKTHDKAPTTEELRKLAKDIFVGKGDYHIDGWEVAQNIEEEEQYEKNERIMNKLLADADLYDKLSEKLQNYDAGKVAAAEGLTADGYAAYKYIVDEVKRIGTNKATQRSVAVGAMLWAHVAERYAEAYQAMGQDVTALDVIKRFKFSNREQGGGEQLNQQRDPYLRSRQENQNAIKDYYSGLEKLEDLAPEDISEAAEKVRFQNAEETRQECESFYQQIVNDGVEDPLGHKVTFVPTLHGKKVSIQEYVGFFIEKRIANSATVSYTKAVAFKNIADTISNPDAIIKGNDGKIQYVKIYEKSKGGILNKTVVTVDGEGTNQFYTMHMNNTKNKKSTLNEMKKVIQNADEILYIRGRQTGHPLHPTDQHASLTDANLHMSGTFILPQFYDSVNRYEDVLTENEKKLLSYPDVQRELSEVREKFKGIEFGAKEGLAPDGTETTLTETQWQLVRTKSFKKLFGDWELAYRQKALAAQRNPIIVPKGVLLKASQLDMGKKAAELIGELPKDVMTENGNVRISKEGLADTFIHGIQDKDDVSQVTNIKGDVVLSLEKGLKNSIYLDRIKDFKRKDAWDEYYAYWVEYDGEKMLVVCRVIDQRTEDDIKKGYSDVSRFENNKQKKYLYVHEVYDTAMLDKIKSISYDTANAVIDGKIDKKASGNDMLQYVLARFINQDSNMKIDVLENGEPNLKSLDNIDNVLMQKAGDGNYDSNNPNNNDVLFQNAQGFIEMQQQGQYIVHLLENADESTFMHEMSHGFFDMLKKMAQDENAPERIKKDYEILRNWTEYNPDQIAEYKGTATYAEFAEMDKRIREAKEKGDVQSYENLVNRWQQERFARGFEEYLRSGKAPTEGMKGIFSKFKNWLVKIYQGCVGVGAKPTDAVRGVMDRMIASQAEIDIAMRKEEMLKWKEAGADEMLSKTSREYYEGLLAKAREEAEAKVLKLAMKDLDEANKAEREKALEKVRADTEAQMRELPVFVIQQYLEQNPGLDVSNVCQMLGNMSEEEYKQALQQQGGSLKAAVDKVVKEVAKQMEPDSAEYKQMLKAAAEEAVATSRYVELIAAYELEAYKKAVHRTRRLEKQLKNIEAKDEAERQKAETDIVRAEKALAEQEDRDNRVKDLRDELRKLKADIRVYGKNSLDEIAQARDYANNRLETLSVGEATDFRKWGNLAVRKHQDAMDMLNAGKMEEAIKLQKDVLVYRMLEKRAYELHRKYEKKTARMTARSRTIAREHSMDANDTYLYNHLLYLFGLTEKDAPKPVDFPGVLQQIMLSADGIVDDNVPESAWINPDDWLQHIITGELPMENGLESLTVEQFRQVEELMQYVYFTGKDRRSIKTLVNDDGTKSTIEEVNFAIAEETDKKRSLRDVRVNIGSDSPLERAMRAARRYKVELLKAETILSAMGESAMKYIYNPLRNCADKELKLNQVVVEKQQAIFGMYHEDIIQALGKKEGEKFLKAFSTEQRYQLGGNTRFKDSKLTHEELICLALNLGTEIGHKRVMDIYELTEGKLRDLLYNLSGADWKLIQNIWDLNEEFWPDLQRVTANVTGVTMEKQEAREFTVASKDGVIYPVRGGYYHLAYDPEKNLKVNQQDADKRLDVQAGGNRRFALGIGMTKERNQYEVKYALKLNFSVMQRALAETVHYISFYETVKDVNRLINTDDFAATVVNYFGEEHYLTLQKWVKDAWALEPETQTATERFNAAIRANQTMSTLGFSSITAMENVLNIFPMMAEIGPLNAVKAVADYYGHMFKTGLTSPMDMFNQNAFIAEHSIFMAERGESIDPNIRKAQAENGLSSDGAVMKGIKNVQDVAFYFITQTDLMLGRPLWMHEYQRVYNECIGQQLDPEVAEAKAVQAGDAAVRHVFGSAADIDRADIQRRQSELIKFMTMFYSYFSTVHNAMVSKGYEYSEQRRKGAGALQAAAPTLVWGAMMWYLMPAIGSAIMRAYLKGSDDDREPDALAKKIASTLASNITGGLPGLRDIVPMTLDLIMGERTYGFRTAPIYEVAQQGMRTVSSIMGYINGKKDEFDVMRSMARVSVYMSRFPLTATNAMITAAQWLNEGDLSDEEMAEYLRAIIMNKKPKK